MEAKTDFDINVHIRWMIRRDMPEVLSIEQSSFEFPWSEEDFIRCLRQRNCIGMVAEYDERVVGFMIYELHKDQLHVLNFSVRPDVRRRGVGMQMVNKLVGKLSQQHAIESCWRFAKQTWPPKCFSRTLASEPWRFSAITTTTPSKMPT